MPAGSSSVQYGLRPASCVHGDMKVISAIVDTHFNKRAMAHAAFVRKGRKISWYLYL